MEDYKLKFINRTLKHIDLVNKYALKAGAYYAEHDSDKLTSLLNSYSLMNKEDKTEEEVTKIDKATLKHIRTNQHHPEFWTAADLSNFSRENPISCECYAMTEEALLETVCDWCAMSEEFNNTPQEWVNKVVNKRWMFTEEQVAFINEAVEKLWEKK